MQFGAQAFASFCLCMSAGLLVGCSSSAQSQSQITPDTDAASPYAATPTPSASSGKPPAPADLTALESSLASPKMLTNVNGRKFVFADPEELTFGGETNEAFVAVPGELMYTRFATGKEGYRDDDPECGPVQLFSADWDPSTWESIQPRAVARRLAIKTTEGKESRGPLGEWESTAVLLEPGQPPEFIDLAFDNLRECYERFDVASISLDLSGGALIEVKFGAFGTITVVEPIGDVLYVVRATAVVDGSVGDLIDPFAKVYNRLANRVAQAQGVSRENIDMDTRESVEYFQVTPAPNPTRDMTVIYEVTGPSSGDVAVTYSTSTGSEQRVVRPPWRKEVDNFARGQVLSMVVSALDSSSAGCRIIVNGRVASENTSTGAYTSATCVAQR